MERATTETEFVSTENYFMDWVEGGKLIANPPWSDDTTSGIYGDGRLGTVEKGRLWLEAAVEERLDTVREIREQHSLRQIKRAWRAEVRAPLPRQHLRDDHNILTAARVASPSPRWCWRPGQMSHML
jgi:hypothetical protein